MKIKVAMVVLVGAILSGCVTPGRSKLLAVAAYQKGQIDAFNELVRLQQRANALDGCKDLMRRAFPETPAEGWAGIDARLTAAVNPQPTPTPSPAPAKKEKPKK